MLALRSFQVRGASSAMREAARYSASSTPPWVTTAICSPTWRAAIAAIAVTARSTNAASVSPPGGPKVASRSRQRRDASGCRVSTSAQVSPSKLPKARSRSERSRSSGRPVDAHSACAVALARCRSLA